MAVILKVGSSNEHVKTLKKLLNTQLGSTLDVNNAYFGNSTKSVVKEFQKKSGLIQDGIVGKLTWDSLVIPSELIESDTSEFLNKAISILKSQIGVKELTGKNDGEAVESYLKSTGLGKGYAWCQAFLYWGFDKASKALKVKNPMPKTAGVLDGWRKSKEFQVKQGSPKVGDIFTMDFGKGTGHAGIVIGVEKNYITTVEGNTSADPTLPSEDRDGQGVYKRRRKISSINNGFIRYTIA